MRSYSFKSILFFCLSFLKKYKWFCLGIIILQIALALTNISLPILFQIIFDEVLNLKSSSQVNSSISPLIKYALYLLTATLFMIVINLILSFWSARVIEESMATIRTSFIKHIIYSPDSFFSKQSKGELLTQFNVDLDALEDLITKISVGIGGLLFSFIASICVIFYYNIPLAFFVIFMSLITLILPKLLLKYLEELSELSREIQEKLATLFDEMIGFQRLIKLFNLHAKFLKKFNSQNHHYCSVNKKGVVLHSILNNLIDLGSMFMLIGLLVLGGILIIKNKLSPGELVAFITLSSVFSGHLDSIWGLFPEYISAKPGISRIINCFDESSENLTPAIFTQQPFKSLDFVKASFCYPSSDDKSLKNITFSLKSGEHLALVGSSGSGKSTIINLLLKLYMTQKGDLFLNNIDYLDIHPDLIRANIAIVTQDVDLVPDTIYNNILFGNLNADKNAVELAAKKAFIHDTIIQLPDKYDTVIDQDGGGLSVGQKQRICLARALIKHADIYIFDEVTSSLDPISETNVQQSIFDHCQNKTMIWITHRLKTISSINSIIALDKGELVESGSHNTLINSNGYYNRMWNKQQGFNYNVASNQFSITIERLQTISIFSFFNQDELKNIADILVCKSFFPYEIIFKEGDTGNNFYIIARGKLNVFNASKGMISTLETGDYFGEIALVENKKRNATIQSASFTQCLLLDKRNFLSILDKKPSVKQDIYDVIKTRKTIT